MANIRKVLVKSAPLAKTVAKTVARNTVGRVPPPPGRLKGKLAKDGGTPVRDTRFRPWLEYPASGPQDWAFSVEPRMRRIFLSGEEGIPQTLAKAFTAKWADYCGVRYSLLLPHGTDALRIAVAATLDHDGLEYGGEIIVPNLSFIASATAALDRRLGVALVDVDPVTLNLDPRRVEEAIIPGKTRAIMAVHLFGQPADMTALREIARRHSLALIEDAAQAHGAIHDLGRTGSLADAAGFSFQSFKNLRSGEGGAFTTSDPEIYERAYEFHNVGRSRIGGERWGHESLGWNCRPTEYVAALLLHRFKTFEQEQQRRHTRFMELREQLGDVTCVEPLGIGPGVQRHGVHMFPMRYRPEACGGLSIEDFLRAVQAEGMPAARAYTMTMAQQPALQRLGEKHPDYLRVLPSPVADEAVKELIYLPHRVFLGSEAEIAEVAAAFRKVQTHYAPEQVGQARAAAAPAPTPAPVVPAAPPVAAAPVRPLRVGLIGAGIMGHQHATAMKSNRRVSLAAVADARPQAARGFAGEFGCRWIASPEELIRSGEIDTVVIATPHWYHADLAIAALRAGMHVVCEKPLSVTVEQADEVLRAAATSAGTFAVVHQTRFEPAYQHVKQLLDSGELGPIYRCDMIESAWRTEAYYQGSPWRGTWKGEGGGVLLNQAPHVLDRYAWLCGMPVSLSAHCDTTLHRIEVEDTASAILRHASGAHGFIHVSTVECPAISRVTIACDRGRITVENSKLQITRLRDSIRERTARDTGVGGDLAGETRTLDFSKVGSLQELLQGFYDNLALTVAGNGRLTCPGTEGRDAVELANAMILSSFQGTAVSLPLDRGEYARLMAKLTERELQTA